MKSFLPISILLAMTACTEERPAKEMLVDDPQAPLPVVITPASFECEKFLSTGEVSEAIQRLAGPSQGNFAAPEGVPDPCYYLTRPDPAAKEHATGAQSEGEHVERWSFDIDCRRTALEDGKALMVQWTRGGGTPLAIGKGAVDHRNTALLFLDDDSPCYVRVVGPRASGRKKLADKVARVLSPETAPLTAATARAQAQK